MTRKITLAALTLALLIPGAASAAEATYTDEMPNALLTVRCFGGPECNWPATNVVVQKWAPAAPPLPIKWRPAQVTIGFATHVVSTACQSGNMYIMARLSTGALYTAEMGENEAYQSIPIEFPCGAGAKTLDTPYRTYSLPVKAPEKYRSARTIKVELWANGWQPEGEPLNKSVSIELVNPTVTLVTR